MTHDEVKEKVLQIVSEKTDIQKEKIVLNSLFIHDLGLDSLAQLDLMLELEDNFQMTIPDEDAERIKTVGDAINYISKNLKA